MGRTEYLLRIAATSVLFSLSLSASISSDEELELTPEVPDIIDIEYPRRDFPFYLPNCIKSECILLISSISDSKSESFTNLTSF